MKRKIFLPLLFLTICVLSALLWTRLQAPLPDSDSEQANSGGSALRTPFVVGILTQAGGVLERQGEQALRGAKIAEQFVQQNGGLLKKPLKLVTRKFGSPADARGLAEELIKKEQAQILLGALDEAATAEVALLAHQSGVHFMQLLNGAPATCQAENPTLLSPFVWSFGLSDEMSLEPFLIYLSSLFQSELRQPTFYYFNNLDPKLDESKARAVRLTNELGFKLLGEDSIDDRVEDLYHRIRGLFETRPDVLFLMLTEAGAGKFIPQASKLGLRLEMNIAAGSFLSEELVQELGVTVEGMRTFTRYLPSNGNIQNKLFLELWKKNSKDEPTAVAATAYSTLLVIQKAFSKAASFEAGEFQRALEDLTVDTPLGRVIMQKTNHVAVLPLYSVQVKEGKFVYSEYLGDISHPHLDGCLFRKPAL